MHVYALYNYCCFLCQFDDLNHRIDGKTTILFYHMFQPQTDTDIKLGVIKHRYYFETI